LVNRLRTSQAHEILRPILPYRATIYSRLRVFFSSTCSLSQPSLSAVLAAERVATPTMRDSTLPPSTLSLPPLVHSLPRTSRADGPKQIPASPRSSPSDPAGAPLPLSLAGGGPRRVWPCPDVPNPCVLRASLPRQCVGPDMRRPGSVRAGQLPPSGVDARGGPLPHGDTQEPAAARRAGPSGQIRP
jgi:hypothetical protein